MTRNGWGVSEAGGNRRKRCQARSILKWKGGEVEEGEEEEEEGRIARTTVFRPWRV